jgi:hypothetical protein
MKHGFRIFLPGRGLGLLALLAGAVTPCLAAPAPEVLEQVVKVEFIKRFTEYVEWPASAFPSDTASFNVCSLGEGPLRPRLQAHLGKGLIQGRHTTIRALQSPEEAGGCHILYVAPSERAEAGRIVDRIGKTSVLTIGDTAGLGKHGIHISLFVVGTRVRFMINAAACKANGLTVSTKLLVLSRSEEEGG